ncbi:type IV toxin-antitoxin system AbiEi family antitoxin [Glaciimonas sp. GG7]
MPPNHDYSYREKELTTAALSALRTTAGITGRILATQKRISPHYIADAVITLQVGDDQYEYVVECKSFLDRKIIIANVKAQLENMTSKGLLIVPYLSAEMAEYCRSIHLEFIDTVGNVYLNAPGLYVFVKGLKGTNLELTSETGRTTNNPTTMRMIFALLCRPELIHASYREIVKVADISLGAVGPVFSDLEKRGLLIDSRKKNDRQLLDPSRLLDEWVTNYPTTLRSKLHARRFRAPDPDWWKDVHFDGGDISWGGEVAAQRMTTYLKPATQTLYVKQTAMSTRLHELIRTYRLRPDPEGPIDILERFWEFSEANTHQDLAPPILVYADLMASLEPRNIELAQLIKERGFENTLHTS